MITNETNYFERSQYNYTLFADTRPQIDWAYHPAVELAKIAEEISSGTNRQEIYQDQERNLATALAERLQALNTTDFFIIKNGTMFSEKLGEPILDIMRRGVRYRTMLGTKDSDREHAEVVGMERIAATLTPDFTPIGTRMIMFSPPSPVPGSPYAKNFVDEFTRVDTDTILRSRTLLKTVPTEQPDSWYLSHPRVSKEPIPDNQKTGMAVEEFEQIMATVWREKAEYLGMLFEPNFDPQKISEAFNNLLDRVDRLATKHRVSVMAIGSFSHDGCGGTGSLGLKALLENSVAQFGDTKNYESGVCQKCQTRGTVGRCTHKCQSCEKIDHPEIFGS